MAFRLAVDEEGVIRETVFLQTDAKHIYKDYLHYPSRGQESLATRPKNLLDK